MKLRLARAVPRGGQQKVGERERTVRSRRGRLGDDTPRRVARTAVVTERTGTQR